MKGVCGLEIEKNTLQGLISIKDKEKFKIVDEFFLPLTPSSLIEGIKENIEKIEKTLQEKEKKNSLTIDKIFLNLPYEEASFKIVEDIFPLSWGKRSVTPKDIEKAKSYIENIVLEWKKFLVHHIVLEYKVDGKSYFSLPPDLEAKNLKLKSFLVYIERKMYEEILEVFDNIERKFTGFVWEPLSSLSVDNFDFLSNSASILMKENYTLCTGIRRGEIFIKKFSFGEKNIKKAIENKFFLSQEVADRLFNWYTYFGERCENKKILIKEKEYIEISWQEFVSLIKEMVLLGIEEIIYFLREKIEEEKIKIVFLGRLAQKKYFFNFLKETFPFLEIVNFSQKVSCLSLYGCVKYGCLRYLEKNRLKKKSLWQKLAEVYKDYF